MVLMNKEYKRTYILGEQQALTQEVPGQDWSCKRKWCHCYQWTQLLAEEKTEIRAAVSAGNIKEHFVLCQWEPVKAERSVTVCSLFDSVVCAHLRWWEQQRLICSIKHHYQGICTLVCSRLTTQLVKIMFCKTWCADECWCNAHYFIT